MSYLVMARKYRPTVFAELIGQDHVVRTLQNAISKDRLSHAYIFSGQRGVGKTTAARLLAKAINCEKGPASEPCNKCGSCKEINEGHSLDVIEIDGASNRGIDEVRQLRENVKFAASRSRYKVYIIDEVHMLTDPAFNALLKTLEEPPGHVKFIMATTAPDRVPATIQSRCQRFDFRLLTRKEIIGQLEGIIKKEGYHISRKVLNDISRAAEGSLRDAQGLLEQVISFAGDEPDENVAEEVLHLVQGEVLARFVKGVAKRDCADLIMIIDELTARGFDMRRFLKELMEWIRGMMLVRVSPKLVKLIPLVEEDRQKLVELAADFTQGRLQALVQTVIEAEKELKSSSSPRYVMEITALRMADTVDFDSLDNLTRRLEELAGKLGPGEEISKRDINMAKSGLKSAGTAISEMENTSTIKESDKLEDDVDREHGAAEFLELTNEEDKSSVPGDEWSNLLEQVKKRKIGLGSFLEHGCMISKDDREMVIGFTRTNSFFLESAQENNHPAILKEVAAGIYGDKFRVRMELIEDGEDRRNDGEDMLRQTDLMKKKQKEALKSPLVQEVIDILGGRVIDVKIL